MGTKIKLRNKNNKSISHLVRPVHKGDCIRGNAVTIRRAVRKSFKIMLNLCLFGAK